MIDFDALVLAPTIGIFAKTDVEIVPLESQPGIAAYGARGVWDVQTYTIVQENGAPLSTSVFTIGLRLADFAIEPVQGDDIVVGGMTYTLDTPEYDGQGGVKWAVKAASAGQETPR